MSSSNPTAAMPAAAGVLSSAQQLQAQEIALSLQDISPCE